MTDPTPLDTAHATMQADTNDAAARLRFYERLADSELFLLLQSEATGDNLSPEMFEIDGANYVLVFDTQERLADLVEGSAHHAALSGRIIATMLAGQGIGLGVNLGVADSSILLPPEALVWLAQMLENAPKEISAQPVAFKAPAAADENLLQAIDAKLATAAGLAEAAYLVQVDYDDGTQGLMLAIIDALPAAQGALAKAVAEVVMFGTDENPLDVTFFDRNHTVCTKLARVGLRFDLPKSKVETHAPAAPGRDPNSPPILR